MFHRDRNLGMGKKIKWLKYENNPPKWALVIGQNSLVQSIAEFFDHQYLRVFRGGYPPRNGSIWNLFLVECVQASPAMTKLN